MKKLYGHGDVIVKEVSEIPEDAKKVDSVKGFTVLAYGEITGHAHCLDGSKTELLENESDRYLRCLEDVELKHQKLDGYSAQDAHETIILPKGDYQIGIVREFDYFTNEARQVAD